MDQTGKNSNRESTKSTTSALLLLELQCPFYLQDAKTCRANGRGAIGRRQEELCCSDEHDSCPSYLGYLLRRSQPLRVDNDWLDAI